MNGTTILRHLQELSKGIDAIQERLDSLEANKASIELLASRVSTGFEMAEAVLGKIAHALGVNDDANVGDDEEDRKRLKVRLKEALEGRRPPAKNSEKPESFLEHYFGEPGSTAAGLPELPIRAEFAGVSLLAWLAGSSTRTQDSCKVIGANPRRCYLLPA